MSVSSSSAKSSLSSAASSVASSSSARGRGARTSSSSATSVLGETSNFHHPAGLTQAESFWSYNNPENPSRDSFTDRGYSFAESLSSVDVQNVYKYSVDEHAHQYYDQSRNGSFVSMLRVEEEVEEDLQSSSRATSKKTSEKTSRDMSQSFWVNTLEATQTQH
ncbi:hypothetical protein BASA81_000650 [Batrachochytrium salamandrivorans]|nr:hypothetical protein BASA81_000650 [Batrachochytrium salamandrivorans]